MLALERHISIVEHLKKQGSIRVSELAKQFGVTDETIRRDLDKLESNGRVIRSHGGAMAADSLRIELPHAQRAQVNQAEKLAIAREAVTRVFEGDCIFLDPSSTTCSMARLLPDQPLTVVTNSIQIALTLSEYSYIKVISIGGNLVSTSLSFQGALAQDAIKRFQVDKLFLSGRGFSADAGLSDGNEQLAVLKQDMIQISQRSYLLLDSSKINTKGLMTVAPPEAFHEIITDEGADPSFEASLIDQGVEVTRVTV